MVSYEQQTKKKRKKGSSHLARAMRMSEIFTRDIGVISLPGDKNCHIVDMDLLTVKKKVSQLMADRITKFQHQWTVLLCVFGRGHDGKEYFKTQEVVTPRPCYHNEIDASLSAAHHKMTMDLTSGILFLLGGLPARATGDLISTICASCLQILVHGIF